MVTASLEGEFLFVYHHVCLAGESASCRHFEFLNRSVSCKNIFHEKRNVHISCLHDIVATEQMGKKHTFSVILVTRVKNVV